MKHVLQLLTAGLIFLIAPFCLAEAPPAMRQTDVVIIGEFHDNTEHHTRQAELLQTIRATAVVYEMLTPLEAEALSDVERDTESMAGAVAGFHWSNIADYASVLANSTKIVGAALPRNDVREAFDQGAAAVFGIGAERFGLTQALKGSELETRKQMQFRAHCEAMPLSMMGGMVEAQRLRDAVFAKTVLEAMDAHGGPVVLITGNGHARKDWGVPAALAAARPNTTVLSIGQGEEGEAPSGTYDRVFYSAPAERGDPCAAFR